MGKRPLGVSRQKEGERETGMGMGRGHGKTEGFETFILALSLP